MDKSGDLRKELTETLDTELIKALHRKKPWRHFMIMFRQFALLGLSTWLLVRSTSIWIVIPAAALSGFTVFNFTVLLHEQLHNLIFAGKRPRLNAFFGQLYAFWSGISCSQFTRWHLDHHAELGTDDNDPKRHHLTPKINSRLIKLSYFTICLFPIYFRAAARETRTYTPELRAKIKRERIVSLGGHVTIQLIFLIFFGVSVWFRAYILPVGVFFPIAFALNRIGQHYNIKEDDPAGWTTWVSGNWFWNFMYLNSNMHLEHHYFSGVPFYNLPGLQKILEPVYIKHGMEPFGYGKLFYGYIILNRKPHTEWDFA